MDSCCPSAYNCSDVVYDVTDADGGQVANITKFWGGGLPGCKGKCLTPALILIKRLNSGCCKECYNANSFVIDYGENQSAKEKVALIGATILLDFAFYQNTNNDS